MKSRESVAAIITYGAGTASGKTSVIVDSSSRNAVVVVIGETGLGSFGLDDVDPHLVVVDRLADVLEHAGDGVADHDPDVDAGRGGLGDHVERRRARRAW